MLMGRLLAGSWLRSTGHSSRALANVGLTHRKTPVHNSYSYDRGFQKGRIHGSTRTMIGRETL